MMKAQPTSIEIGTALGRARRARGMSLAELSERTRLSVAVLIAIERNQLDRLPGGVFIRGFLRAYAREVGCDPQSAVGQYLARIEMAHLEEQRTARVLRPDWSRHRVKSAAAAAPRRRRSSGLWTAGALAIVACALLYVWLVSCFTC
jgi:cytoskeletal protein RodZ